MEEVKMKIARSILGKEKFIELYGKENLPNLKMRVILRHDRNRKGFERIFPLSGEATFEGYTTGINYPVYLIDRFTFIENKDLLNKSVTITNIKPC